MKTLYLARHAKSDWGQAGYSDHDRPLNERGLSDAKAMAQHLVALEIRPDSIISSTALRALTTAKIYADQILNMSPPLKLEAIYQADEIELLSIIKDLANGINSIILVGHNPTISLLVDFLSGQSVNMSAGSIAELQIDDDAWQNLDRNGSQLLRMLSPKDIPAN